MKSLGFFTRLLPDRLDALFTAFGGDAADRNEIFADNFRRLVAALAGEGIDARRRPMHPRGRRVLDGLAGDPIVGAATDLIVQAHPVDPPADVLDSIELIASDVAPALGWRSATSARP